MRVLILAESFRTAARIWRSCSVLDGVELHVLLANNRDPLWRYLPKRLADFLLLGPRDQAALLGACRRRRLHMRLKPLHAEGTVAWLARQRFDVGLHGMPVIYRAPVLGAFANGVLNAHIGLLPRFRGRSVMEWSILLGEATGVSVFFMDEGIDTGARIVTRREVDVSGFQSPGEAKAHLFRLDGEMFAEALAKLQDRDAQLIEQRPEEGTRFYVMSQLVAGAVTESMAALAPGGASGT